LELHSDVSEALSASITSPFLMMEAARTYETSIDNYFTRQYSPEDNSELHTRRRENFKSHDVSEVRTASIIWEWTGDGGREGL
jgi:hypothetical protein